MPYLQLWGSSGRTYLTWTELKTILYLKISISDFLTLFSARSRGWFWERCVSWPLGLAFILATGISTLLALFWYVTCMRHVHPRSWRTRHCYDHTCLYVVVVCVRAHGCVQG